MIKSPKELVKEYLGDDKTRKIGVYGFGGADTSFLIEEDEHWKDKGKFDFKIRVTIGQEFDAFRVQKSIGEQLKRDITDYDDPIIRAGLVYTALEGKSYLLFLDDVWEAFSLEDVGIPDPDEDNHSKLVLATWSLEVCQSMGCKIVKEEPLLTEEAPKLIGETEEKLRFGFSLLEKRGVLQCLLFCSYYPKDCEILKEDLIEHWIDAGLMGDMETMQAKYDRCHAVINTLESCCFIRSIDNGNSIKMHNLARLMAFDKQFAGDKVMVKAGMELKTLPNKEEWLRRVEKVSLMKNSISEISKDAWPVCEMLTTLLLQKNPLTKIGDLFFKNTPKLGILDLSYTNIVKLPESISDLGNLTALILKRCWQLRHVPPIAKLKALRKLDLSYTSIREIPEGLALLVKLRYLNLYTSTLESFPSGILPNLSRLQHLVLDWTSERSFARVDELRTLKRLEIFVGQLYGLYDLNEYINILRNGKPDKYILQVGLGSLLLPPISVHKVSKEVRLRRRSINIALGVPILVLPWDLGGLRLEECNELRSLCDVHSLRAVNELKTCELVECDGIKCLLTCSSSISICSCSSLRHVEILNLSCLRNFDAIHVGDSCELPFGTFRSLKKFTMYRCPGIKKLIALEMVTHFSNLEELHIKRCEQLEVIVAGGATDDQHLQCRFPKLRSLKLWGLPKLNSICPGSIVCASLKYLRVFDCPKLKKIPLYLPSMDDIGFGPPASLERIVTTRDWWDSTEREFQDARQVLEPHCDFSCF